MPSGDASTITLTVQLPAGVTGVAGVTLGSRSTKEAPTVTHVDPATHADAAGLVPGHILHSVAGVPVLGHAHGALLLSEGVGDVLITCGQASETNLAALQEQSDGCLFAALKWIGCGVVVVCVVAAALVSGEVPGTGGPSEPVEDWSTFHDFADCASGVPVSYTHLTLPTICSV